MDHGGGSHCPTTWPDSTATKWWKYSPRALNELQFYYSPRIYTLRAFRSPAERKASGVVLGVAWLHENWLGGQWTMTNIFYYNVESPAMCSVNMLCFGSTSLFDTSQFCFLKMIGLKWKPVWFENKYLKDKKPEKESIRCDNCAQKPHARCILYAENQFNDNVIEKNVMQFYCISYLKALASVFIVISGYICIVFGCSKISFYSFVHF